VRSETKPREPLNEDILAQPFKAGRLSRSRQKPTKEPISMGFVTVARQFVGGKARTVSDGLEDKNFRQRKVTLCPTADWAQLSEHSHRAKGGASWLIATSKEMNDPTLPPTFWSGY